MDTRTPTNSRKPYRNRNFDLKYPGKTCAECGRSITVGDRVRYTDEMHIDLVHARHPRRRQGAL